MRISLQLLSGSRRKKGRAKGFEELTEILFDMRCGGCLLCAAVQDITAEEDALKWRGDETWTIEPTMHPFNPPTHSLPLPAQDAASPVSLRSINDRIWGGLGCKNRSNTDACNQGKENRHCWWTNSREKKTFQSFLFQAVVAVFAVLTHALGELDTWHSRLSCQHSCSFWSSKSESYVTRATPDVWTDGAWRQQLQ